MSTVPTKGSESWKPRTYQHAGMKFLAANKEAGLLYDPGLGKTSTVLGVLSAFKRQNIPCRTLIVAPLKVAHNTWPGELERWKDFKDLTFEILHGKDKEKAARRPADIYIINPEGLAWLTKGYFKQLGVNILVIDESTKFKHSNTQRFKFLKPLLPKFDRRWILTGTPAPNGLEDLFGQIYVMDLGKRLGRYITHYRTLYFTPQQVGVVTSGPMSGRPIMKYRPAPGAEALIYEALKDCTHRLDAKDHLELPELVENDILLTLPKEARKIYDNMESENIAELLDGSAVAVGGASGSTVKLRQIAGGALYETPPEDAPAPKNKRWDVLHTEKLDALESLIEELQGQPLLVGYEFQHELERIQERFGRGLPHLGVAPTQQKNIITAWNRGEIPVLLGQKASMAHGLNLQGACGHVCTYTETWDWEVADQFVKRVLRQGNKMKKVVHHKLIMRDTVDVAVYAALRSKDKTQRGLLEHLRQYARQRGFM